MTATTTRQMDWTQPDYLRLLFRHSAGPLGFAADDKNLSRYVGNSPTFAIDPTGLVEEGAARETDEEEEAMAEEEAAAEDAADSTAPPDVEETPFEEFAQQWHWSEETTNDVHTGGCQALTSVLTGIPTGPMPYNAPGVVAFSDFNSAWQYYLQQQRQGHPVTFFAYQNTAPPNTPTPGSGAPAATPGWTPPASGAIDPVTIVSPLVGEKNFSTLLPCPAIHSYLWTWMNNSGGDIQQSELDMNDPNGIYGLYPDSGTIDPATGQPKIFQTTVYCVYVLPPPPPPPSWLDIDWEQFLICFPG